jgi:hypothetical protein
VDVQSIGTALQRLVLDPSDAVGLMRADGQILVRASREGVTTPPPLPPDSPLVARMQRGEALAVSAGPSTVDGSRRVGAIRRVGAWPIDRPDPRRGNRPADAHHRHGPGHLRRRSPRRRPAAASARACWRRR